MNISPKLNIEIESRYPLFKRAIEQGKTISPDSWQFYQDSERQLIELMNGKPSPENAPGNLEASWVLYCLNHYTSSLLLWALQKLGMPGTQIAAPDWAKWETTWEKQGVLMGDGSLVSTAPYAILDLLWGMAFLDYMLLQMEVLRRYPNFGTTPASLTIGNQNQLVVALFSDWGSGNYTDGNLPASPSQLIAKQITAVNPDFSIHLGDVYYSGTKDEEQSNLLNCWPPGKLGNFILNANHEMYDGANGYFTTALSNSTFKGQNNTSYFKIEFGNWLIVGIDTAYYDTSELFLTGALTDSNQIAFLNEVGKSGKNIVILTHHVALNTCGDARTVLYNQVVDALGVAPAYWYWGHIHNGIVYSSGSASGALTKCRCIGNGAIPIGNASWLQNSPSTVSFYTDKPLENPQSPQQDLRVLNGYAILTFNNDAVIETWYYQDGSLAWSSQ